MSFRLVDRVFSPGGEKTPDRTRSGIRNRTKVGAPLLAAIDIGNTRVTVGLFSREGELEPVEVRHMRTSPQPQDFSGLLAGLPPVTRLVVASVVPNATEALIAASRWPVTTIAPAENLGLRLEGVDYSELGADLFVNAVASRHLFGDDILNVDLGTASTFCVITDGLYRGTTICPGLEISLKALTEMTALLPRVEVKRLDRLIQQKSQPCMQTGAYYGHLEMARGLIRRAQAEWGRLEVVLTGGIGALLEADLADVVDHYEPYLTLKGISLIAEKL